MNWDEATKQTAEMYAVCNAIGKGALRGVVPCITPEDEAQWALCGTTGAGMVLHGNSICHAEHHRISCATKLEEIVGDIHRSAFKIWQEADSIVNDSDGLSDNDYLSVTKVSADYVPDIQLVRTHYTDWDYNITPLEDHLPDLRVAIENYAEAVRFLDEAIDVENKAVEDFLESKSAFMRLYNELWRMLVNRIKSGV